MHSGTRTILWLVVAAAIVAASIPVFLMVAFLAMVRLTAMGDRGPSPHYNEADGPAQRAFPAPMEARILVLEERARAAPVRTVLVRVAADEEFRADAGVRWRKGVVDRVRRASRVLERVCRVKLEVLEVRECESNNWARDIHELHRQLDADLVDDAADVVIAFVRQHAPVDGPSNAYDRGVAYYFGRSCIVRTGLPSRPKRAWGYEHETLLHELGHVLGTFHSRDWRSVMRPDKRWEPRRTYDVQARATLLLMREYDFAGGPESIPEETVTELLRIFRTDRYPGTVNPLLWAFASRGGRRAGAGDVEGALADRIRARNVLAQLGSTVRPPALERLDRLAAEHEARSR